MDILIVLPTLVCVVVDYLNKYQFTHPTLDKMAFISQTTFSNKKFCIAIKISLKFVPDGPIDNSPALVEVMAWRRTGDKPLSEPMLSQFTDAYMRHWDEMN